MDSNSLRKRNFILQSIYKLFFSWVDISLSVGKLNRDFCLSHGIDKSRIISSPHIVDNNFFYIKADEAGKIYDELRHRWEIPSKAYCFIYAGKLQRKKRPLDLMTAFKLACSLTDRQIHLMVVGSGPLETLCKEFAQINNLPVSFVGFLNQTAMPEAYAIADCIVLPSDEGETWGLVINEAMACGLPAIVSNSVGCAPDLIIDGVTGFTFECGDTVKLAEQLVYMAEHKDLSQEMGKNAQCTINNKYNLNRVVESIETAMYCLNG